MLRARVPRIRRVSSHVGSCEVAGTGRAIVVGVVLVFVIAGGVVGREARRLDAIAPRTLYIDAEAVDFVAATLTPAAQERVTPRNSSELLRAHMFWLWSRGLQPDKAVDQRQAHRPPGGDGRRRCHRLPDR